MYVEKGTVEGNGHTPVVPANTWDAEAGISSAQDYPRLHEKFMAGLSYVSKP